jgi:Spy/CpxP family protein refolding chaperone
MATGRVIPNSMKPTLLAAALTLCLTSPVWAQDAPSGGTPPADGGGGHHWGGGGGGLTDDQKAELKSAHDAAIAANPDLENQLKTDMEALQADRKKLNDAMVAADPKVKDLLDKMPHHFGPPPQGGGGQ